MAAFQLGICKHCRLFVRHGMLHEFNVFLNTPCQTPDTHSSQKQGDSGVADNLLRFTHQMGEKKKNLPTFCARLNLNPVFPLLNPKKGILLPSDGRLMTKTHTGSWERSPPVDPLPPNACKCNPGSQKTLPEVRTAWAMEDKYINRGFASRWTKQQRHFKLDVLLKAAGGSEGRTHPSQALLQGVQDDELGEVEVLLRSFSKYPLWRQTTIMKHFDSNLKAWRRHRYGGSITNQLGFYFLNFRLLVFMNKTCKKTLVGSSPPNWNYSPPLFDQL